MKVKLFSLLIVGLMSVHVSGDGRRYVWTYEYQTLPAGEAELESYTDFWQIETDSTRQATTILQYEYEIGMNDHFDVGIYQKFKQLPNTPITYDGFKIRMRFRLGEAGQWPMDPLIYLEYKNDAGFEQSSLETKLILAKDFDKINLSINPGVEFELGGSQTNIKFEYSAGVSYRLHPLISVGLETKGTTNTLYWGPTLSHGKEDLWFALGLLMPTSGEDLPDRKIRFIIGVGL